MESGLPYSSRVAAARAGVGALRLSRVKKANALNDSISNDTLTGGGGTDWFFRVSDDVLSDLVSGEQIDLL